MPTNITLNLLPQNTSPLANDILHSRTNTGVDEYLLLSTLQAFLVGLDSTKITAADYNTLTNPGIYRNSSATNSPDTTANEFLVEVCPYAGNAMQVVQMAISTAGIYYFRYQNASNVWSTWSSLSTRGYDDLVIKNLSASVDFNTLVNSGFYTVSGISQANAPDGTTNSFWFLKINAKGGDSTNIFQEAKSQTSGEIYFRFNTSGSWGKWALSLSDSSWDAYLSTALDVLVTYNADGSLQLLQYYATTSEVAGNLMGSKTYAYTDSTNTTINTITIRIYLPIGTLKYTRTTTFTYNADGTILRTVSVLS